jgi:hypothetical protein
MNATDAKTTAQTRTSNVPTKRNYGKNSAQIAPTNGMRFDITLATLVLN